jgi:hypothetical protein
MWENVNAVAPKEVPTVVLAELAADGKFHHTAPATYFSAT